VAIVGEMAIRRSFASRGSVRREWRRSGIVGDIPRVPLNNGENLT
jgi:hypothetical protein